MKIGTQLPKPALSRDSRWIVAKKILNKNPLRILGLQAAQNPLRRTASPKSHEEGSGLAIASTRYRIEKLWNSENRRWYAKTRPKFNLSPFVLFLDVSWIARFELRIAPKSLANRIAGFGTYLQSENSKELAAVRTVFGLAIRILPKLSQSPAKRTQIVLWKVWPSHHQAQRR